MTAFQHAFGPVVKVACNHVLANWIERCKAEADHKYRFCAHPETTDPIHEMLIVHTNETIVPVHKHAGKSESFHWIEGYADVVLYNDDGSIREVIPMGPYGSERVFYYRLNADIYHTLVIHSPVVVFHEVTNGPWSRADMIIAPFWRAPKGWSR